jgi:hypothetical protein
MSEGTAFLIGAALAIATTITIFVALEGLLGLAYALPFVTAGLLLARWLQGWPVGRRGADSAPAPSPRLEGRKLWLALGLALLGTLPGLWLELGWLGAAPVLASAAAALVVARRA